MKDVQTSSRLLGELNDLNMSVGRVSKLNQGSKLRIEAYDDQGIITRSLMPVPFVLDILKQYQAKCISDLGNLGINISEEPN